MAGVTVGLEAHQDCLKFCNEQFNLLNWAWTLQEHKKVLAGIVQLGIVCGKVLLIEDVQCLALDLVIAVKSKLKEVREVRTAIQIPERVDQRATIPRVARIQNGLEQRFYSAIVVAVAQPHCRAVSNSSVRRSDVRDQLLKL